MRSSALRPVSGAALAVSALAVLGPAPASARPSEEHERPRLVAVIVFDQLGYQTLLRARPHLGKGGFAELMERGAYFTDARYRHANTLTGPGHACVASGSYAYKNGIVANRFYDRATGKVESMMHDATFVGVGDEIEADGDTSPTRFIGETLGDRLLIASSHKARVVSLSAKDRSAIAMGGKLGSTFWYSPANGRFITSTYYMKELPPWLDAFNARKVADGYFGKKWERVMPVSAYSWNDDGPGEAGGKALGKTFPHPLTGGLAAPGEAFYEDLRTTPFINEIEFQLARAAVEGEKLGEDDEPDLLFLSVTGTDYVGHVFGPDSHEMQDAIVRTDRWLAEFLGWLRARTHGRLLLAVTADHGASPIPETAAAMGLDAGRVHPDVLREAIEKGLDEKFVKADWVGVIDEPSLYLQDKALAAARVDRESIERAACEAALTVNGIGGCFTRSQLLRGDLPRTPVGDAFQVSFHPARSGDLMIYARPFWLWGTNGAKTTGTGHGSPWRYDQHVPLFLQGPGVPRGLYTRPVEPADIAPTLARLLGIGEPAGADGRSLFE